MVIPVLEWEYPDTLDKMIMNEIVVYGFIDSRKINNFAPDADVVTVVLAHLAEFVTEGYVTSATKTDATTGQNYTEWAATDFFRLMIQEQRARVAAEEKAKQDLWDAQQAELPPEERFNPEL